MPDLQGLIASVHTSCPLSHIRGSHRRRHCMCLTQVFHTILWRILWRPQLSRFQVKGQHMTMHVQLYPLSAERTGTCRSVPVVFFYAVRKRESSCCNHDKLFMIDTGHCRRSNDRSATSTAALPSPPYPEL